MRSALDHLLSQFFRSLADAGACCEMVLMFSVCIGLLLNAFIVTNDGVVRHALQTHTTPNNLLYNADNLVQSLDV
jgi:hypothetical protein